MRKGQKGSPTIRAAPIWSNRAGPGENSLFIFPTGKTCSVIPEKFANQMRLRFCEEEIATVAMRYNYGQSEDDLASPIPEVRVRGYLLKDELVTIACRKSPRTGDHSSRNDEDEVQKVTIVDFASSQERVKGEILTTLDGVGWPSASVILHFFDELRFPIVDFSAFWSLGAEVLGNCTDQFRREYVEFTRGIASRADVDTRTLDRALLHDAPLRTTVRQTVRRKLAG